MQGPPYREPPIKNEELFNTWWTNRGSRYDPLHEPALREVARDAWEEVVRKLTETPEEESTDVVRLDGLQVQTKPEIYTDAVKYLMAQNGLHREDLKNYYLVMYLESKDNTPIIPVGPAEKKDLLPR